MVLEDGDPALDFDMSQQERTIVYDEPWGWMMPARHALGALLLKRVSNVESTQTDEDTDLLLPVDEAKACYHADLGLLAEGGATLPHSHNLEHHWLASVPRASDRA